LKNFIEDFIKPHYNLEINNFIIFTNKTHIIVFFEMQKNFFYPLYCTKDKIINKIAYRDHMAILLKIKHIQFVKIAIEQCSSSHSISIY
jgi:hypothetical protein